TRGAACAPPSVVGAEMSVIRLPKLRWIAGGTLIFLGTLCAFQRPFREYPGIEYNDFPLPADWQHKSEFAFARLMYPPYTGQGGFGFGGYSTKSWQEGNSIWTQD